MMKTLGKCSRFVTRRWKLGMILGVILSVLPLIYILLHHRVRNQPFAHPDEAMSKLRRLPQPDGRAKKVLIVAYERGGSTFLGDIFNSHPRMFYMFEPLIGLYGGLHGVSRILSPVVSKDKSQLSRASRRMNRLKQEITNNTLNCRVAKWNMDMLSRFDFIEKSRHLNDVFRCAFPTRVDRQRARHCIDGAKAYFSSIRTNVSFNQLWFTRENLFSKDMKFIKGREVRSDVYPWAELKQISSRLEVLFNCYRKLEPKLQQCFLKLDTEMTCRTSVVRAVKTIRLHLDFVAPILQKDPDLYVIYLLRDPRGILYSKSKVGEVKSWKESAGKLCDVMRLNRQAMDILEAKHPGRILTVKYEDFADSTVETMKGIYRFLQLPWMETSMKLFKIKTSHKSKHAYSTMRSNSSATAHAWENVLSRVAMKQIDSRCKTLYQPYGWRSSEGILTSRLQARSRNDGSNR